jgi:hypothetical protein
MFLIIHYYLRFKLRTSKLYNIEIHVNDISAATNIICINKRKQHANITLLFAFIFFIKLKEIKKKQTNTIMFVSQNVLQMQ